MTRSSARRSQERTPSAHTKSYTGRWAGSNGHDHVNGVHDLGGSHGHGPVVAEPGGTVFHQPWEGRVYAMMSLCRQRGLFNLDEMRNAIEHMPPAEYLASSYYERWLSALERLISEKEATGPKIGRAH